MEQRLGCTVDLLTDLCRVFTAAAGMNPTAVHLARFGPPSALQAVRISSRSSRKPAPIPTRKVKSSCSSASSKARNSQKHAPQNLQTCRIGPRQNQTCLLRPIVLPRPSISIFSPCPVLKTAMEVEHSYSSPPPSVANRHWLQKISSDSTPAPIGEETGFAVQIHFQTLIINEHK